MTSTGFDEAWAAGAVAQLHAQGVRFASGMTDADLAAVEAHFGCPLPSELSTFLRAGIPVSSKWARWTDGIDVVATESRKWLHRTFAFDIEQNAYWHVCFGERPDHVADAIDQALAVVAMAPPLIPIYSHRFLVSQPLDGPRAVLSVWQAVDSIFYGNDLADYFAREFRIERPEWSATDAPRVPVWEDLFDLFGEWNTDDAT